MKTSNFLLSAAFCLLGLNACSESSPAKKNPTIEFREAAYFHRWSGGNQHEFTPDGQEDLEKWTDMVTVIYYPEIKDGEGLARVANVILDTYKQNKAAVIKTDSVPRTEKTEAEHLIVVLFTQPDFMEVAFCRVLIREGAAVSVVYSHRAYGKDVSDEMNKWLNANGPATEKAVMGLAAIPRADEL
jgi:hypothetical protein